MLFRSAKNKCLFHSINEDEFETTWKILKRLVGLMHTDYRIEDLSYEELTVNRRLISETSQ